MLFEHSAGPYYTVGKSGWMLCIGLSLNTYTVQVLNVVMGTGVACGLSLPPCSNCVFASDKIAPFVGRRSCCVWCHNSFHGYELVVPFVGQRLCVSVVMG